MKLPVSLKPIQHAAEGAADFTSSHSQPMRHVISRESSPPSISFRILAVACHSIQDKSSSSSSSSRGSSSSSSTGVSAAQPRKQANDHANTSSSFSRAPSPANDLFIQDNLSSRESASVLPRFEQRKISALICMRGQRQKPRGLGRRLSFEDCDQVEDLEFLTSLDRDIDVSTALKN